MRKKKRVQIEKYWENSLKLKYSEELEHYNRLCGKECNHRLFKKNRKYDTDSDFLTYEQWKNHVLDSIKDINLQKLEEYSRFLNQQVRSNDNMLTLSQTIFTPLLFCLCTICFSPLANSIKIEDFADIIVYFFFLIAITFFYGRLLVKLLGITKKYHKYFYQDMKEIVDDRIEELRRSEEYKR